MLKRGVSKEAPTGGAGSATNSRRAGCAENDLMQQEPCEIRGGCAVVGFTPLLDRSFLELMGLIWAQ